jgi:hypothetical protein
MFMIAIGGVACLLTMSCQPSEPRTVAPKDSVATDNRESKVMRYMTCLGFSTDDAAKTWKAAKGDANKVLTMAHMAVTGDLSGATPPNEREKACLKSSGL